MNSSIILSTVTFIYALAATIYLFNWVFKKENSIATWIALIGLIGNLGGIMLRWKESYDLGIGHAPLSNLYESLVFFAAVIIMVYLWIERNYRNKVIGVFTTPLSFLAMAYASLNPNVSDRIQPLIPALKSNWLIAHVITCFVGYAAFAVAFGVSLMYIIRGRRAEKTSEVSSKIPANVELEELTHKLIMFGLLFLSTGIITGAVWANSAWGRYWGWDPKETWSFITWLIYFALLHAWRMRSWRGIHTAGMSILGFLAVLFTYFGVNYLPGLHSYGATGQ